MFYFFSGSFLHEQYISGASRLYRHHHIAVCGVWQRFYRWLHHLYRLIWTGNLLWSQGWSLQVNVLVVSAINVQERIIISIKLGP